MITTTFAFEKETKGAVRLAEVDGDGNVCVTQEKGADAALIGTLYVRKVKLPEGRVPKGAKVTVEFTY